MREAPPRGGRGGERSEQARPPGATTPPGRVPPGCAGHGGRFGRRAGSVANRGARGPMRGGGGVATGVTAARRFAEPLATRARPECPPVAAAPTR